MTEIESDGFSCSINITPRTDKEYQDVANWFESLSEPSHGEATILREQLNEALDKVFGLQKSELEVELINNKESIL